MRRTIVGGCVVLLWAGVCFARGVTITGRVVDYEARLVSEAEVAVIENGPDWDTQLQEARVCGPIGRTDGQGRFEVKADVESLRNVFVVIRKPGLAMAWDKAPTEAGSASDIRFHLVMEKPLAISGKVVDSSGQAVAGANVRAVPKTSYLTTLDQSPISMPASWLSTTSDAEGRFRFDFFSADSICDFWVRAEGYHCVHLFTTNYLPGCGYEVGRSDIRLVLPVERRVQGRVVEQGTDRPVADVELAISIPGYQREDTRNPYVPYRVRSDANGVFVFPGVPEGEHEIEPTQPEHKLPAWFAEAISVQVAPDSATEDLTVEAVEGGIVEILVRDAKTQGSLSGIRVSLPNMPVSRMPVTDSHGVARACLRPGKSRALISSGVGSNREYQSWGLRGQNDGFFVIRGETLRIEVDLEPANWVRGTVVDPDGKAAGGVAVKVHPLGTGSRLISNVGDETGTDAAGRFEFPCGEADPVGWYVTACCEERGLAGVAEITTFQEPVKIALRPAVTVKGTVVTEDGIGIPSARVAVLTHVSGAVSSVTTETLCDGGGVFSIPAVLPTDAAVTHRLCVDASGYGPKSYVDIEVSDQAGATTDLGRIALPVANESLSGIVVDANDHPAAGIPIFLRRASREVIQPQKTTATDEGGRFRFERICKGPVHLQASFSNSPRGWASTKVEAGRQDVRIVLKPGEQSANLRIAAGLSQGSPQYVSLAGKQLAQVKGLESLAPPETADKPVLILFMDQQQRPSRRIAPELAGRMDLLREKGIEIVAMQVAPVDRVELDRWFADQKIPFKAQLLEGDFNKQRYAWGVQSLPWLILTDKNHTVRAEGFGLDELNEKIRSTESTK
ncbi:MAG: hypothetical protein KBE65_16200 [Phycisphaerae bacterium]|nr:hypothetical protein [Phycisphaerae bacterium]